MAKELEQYDDLKSSLEELISLAAQTADKSTVNLTTKFESFQQDQVSKDEKRWDWFKWVIGGLAGVLTVLVPVVFMTFERMYEKLDVISQRQAVIETRDKEQPTFQYLEKTTKELEKELTKLQERIGHCISQKELSDNKKEIMDWLLQLFKETKYDKNINSGR